VAPQTGYLAFRDRRFLIPLLILLFFIGTLQYLGHTFALFDIHSLGFDKLLHFLAGIACGVFGVGLLSMGFWNSDSLCTVRTTNLRVWTIAITLALLVGVGYEILQVWAPFFQNGSTHNWYDTIGDVVFDVTGGVVAGLAYQIRKN
jgi:hypothetical protein